MNLGNKRHLFISNRRNFDSRLRELSEKLLKKEERNRMLSIFPRVKSIVFVAISFVSFYICFQFLFGAHHGFQQYSI